MFRTYDHPQGANIVPSLNMQGNGKIWTRFHIVFTVQLSPSFLITLYNFSKGQFVLPEDDHGIETCGAF